jgi:16S rRNA (adenine1518-N6/adenine1519-N6)-dimethyltransferase
MTRRAKLGQHFLADAAFRRKIAESLEMGERDWVVEVGAGRGELTELLAQRAGHVIAIELDAKLVAGLREKFQGDERVAIVAGDILNLDVARLVLGAPDGKCFVFGNLPYYITSPILHRLLDTRQSVRAMALLMQREVAERVVAKPGSRSYGYLSVLVQLFSRPKIWFDVPPGAFAPRPEVVSSLVQFQMAPMFPEWSRARSEQFLEFVKRCFGHKRKNLRNNLAASYRRDRLDAALGELRLPAAVRAEQLLIPGLAELFRKLEKD